VPDKERIVIVESSTRGVVGEGDDTFDALTF
jgi:hypothetical protein